jgi:hypothetical protein
LDEAAIKLGTLQRDLDIIDSGIETEAVDGLFRTTMKQLAQVAQFLSEVQVEPPEKCGSRKGGGQCFGLSDHIGRFPCPVYNYSGEDAKIETRAIRETLLNIVDDIAKLLAKTCQGGCAVPDVDDIAELLAKTDVGSSVPPKEET